MGDNSESVAEVDDCSLYGSWMWSVLGAAIAIPLGIRRKSLAPLVFYGSTGAMLDIWVGLSNCERAKQEQLASRMAEEEKLSIGAGMDSATLLESE